VTQQQEKNDGFFDDALWAASKLPARVFAATQDFARGNFCWL
jgi:hypothetical protein